MNPHSPRHAIRSAFFAAILAGLFAAPILLRADEKKTPPPSPKQAVKTPPKPGPKTATTTAAPANQLRPANRPYNAPAVNHPANTPSTIRSGGPATINRPGFQGNANPGMTRGVNPPTRVGNAARPSFNRPLSPIHTLAPVGSNTRTTPSGSALRTRPTGGISDVYNAKLGMNVHNNLGGGRVVTAQGPNSSLIVSERGRPGYVQRPYTYNGQNFTVRNYSYHGRTYNAFYRGYGFRGVTLNVYAPAVYYHPAFYGWAYNPWAAPISFTWGWTARPWFLHFGYYFQPYPTYPSAAFWLTDYMIAQDLQASYAANQQAGEADGTAPPPATDGSGASTAPALTPEVKQDIADEVKNQLAIEQSEAQQNTQGQAAAPTSSGIALLLSDGRPHTFVAGGHLDVTDDSGKECVVSDGDTLQLRQAPPNDATIAKLVVLSSKGVPECEISLTVQVQLTDLQEMQNHMRETIDKGLEAMQAKQGSDGLPAAPPSAQGTPDPAAYASAAPPPDPNAATEIQQQNAQATQAVQDVRAEAAQGAGGQSNAVPPPSSPAGPSGAKSVLPNRFSAMLDSLSVSQSPAQRDRTGEEKSP